MSNQDIETKLDIVFEFVLSQTAFKLQDRCYAVRTCSMESCVMHPCCMKIFSQMPKLAIGISHGALVKILRDNLSETKSITSLLKICSYPVVE